MGVVGSVLGGSLLGVGMSASGSGKSSFNYGTDVQTSMQSGKPAAPETPTESNLNDSSAQANMLMEEERDKERQKAAWRREQAREVFTSGLGATGLAETNRKSLLGG